MSQTDKHFSIDPTPNKPSGSSSTSPMADVDLDGPGETLRATLTEGLVSCPNCQGLIEPNPVYAGQTVTCPHCGRPFAMPEMPAVDLQPSRDPGPVTHRNHVVRPSQEPWFYSFIDLYAKLWLWASLVAFTLTLFLTLALFVGMPIGPTSARSWGALIFPLTIAIVFVPSLLGIFLTVACMRLLVDIARNLREIRHRESNPWL